MMHENKRDLQMIKLLEAFRELPIEYKDAVLWIVEHYNDVKNKLEKENMTEDELIKYINYAKKHNQYLLHSLLLFKMCCNDSKM